MAFGLVLAQADTLNQCQTSYTTISFLDSTSKMLDDQIYGFYLIVGMFGFEYYFTFELSKKIIIVKRRIDF